MNAFVDECRREWRRLGVPDSLAEEMASDLEADLEDASAEGVSAPEILGDGDPDRFAREWAVARGLVSEERLGRRRWIVAVAVVLLVGGLTTLALALTGTLNSPGHRKTVPLPLVVGVKGFQAAAILRARDLHSHIVLVRSRRAGIVVAQRPAPGALVERGSTIRLQVGRGG